MINIANVRHRGEISSPLMIQQAGVVGVYIRRHAVIHPVTIHIWPRSSYEIPFYVSAEWCHGSVSSDVDLGIMYAQWSDWC